MVRQSIELSILGTIRGFVFPAGLFLKYVPVARERRVRGGLCWNAINPSLGACMVFVGAERSVFSAGVKGH